MHPTLIYKLILLTTLCPTKLIITSGLRTVEHNKKVGGSKNSYHLTGKAVDILTTEMEDDTLFCIEKEGKKLFNGFGKYGKHIHLDIRDKPYTWKGKYK